MASSSCCLSFSYDEYCGKSIWLKPTRSITSVTAFKTRTTQKQLTSMSLWQSVRVSIRPMNREPLRPLHALQISKPTQRHPRRPRRETQHLRTFVTIERLQRTPPPYDDWVRGVVPVVVCRCTPFVNVDLGGSGDEEFELLFVELQGRGQLSVEVRGKKEYDRDLRLRRGPSE